MLQLRSETEIDAEGEAPPADRAPVPAGSDGLPTPRRYWAIAAISFGTALIVVDGAIANVALPTIATDLGVSDASVTNVVTVYQLAMVMVLLPFATIGDRVGHRNLYQFGQVLFCLASAAAFFASNIWTLLAVRALQAIGGGIALSVSAAMLRAIYPARNLGTGMGINSVIVASSYAIAPTLGGFITQQFDWHWVFVSAAPLAVFSLALGRTLPDPQPRPMKIDWTGGGWSALTVLLLVGGLAIATHSRPEPGIAAIVVGTVSAILLARYERRRDRPVLPNCDDSHSKTLWMNADWVRRSPPREALYDLIFDPNEGDNLVNDARCRRALAEMRDRLDRWMRKTEDPLLNGAVPLPEGARANDADGVSPREP